MNKAENLAKIYADSEDSCWNNDYNGFYNGFNRGQKETVEQIKEKINLYRNLKALKCDEFTLDLIDDYLNRFI